MVLFAALPMTSGTLEEARTTRLSRSTTNVAPATTSPGTVPATGRLATGVVFKAEVTAVEGPRTAKVVAAAVVAVAALPVADEAVSEALVEAEVEGDRSGAVQVRVQQHPREASRKLPSSGGLHL